MQWENLTATEFAAAVRETGVCVFPIGVVEKHSEHLPLGTDFLNAHRVACLAAEKSLPSSFRPFTLARSMRRAAFPARSPWPRRC